MQIVKSGIIDPTWKSTSSLVILIDVAMRKVRHIEVFEEQLKRKLHGNS